MGRFCGPYLNKQGLRNLRTYEYRLLPGSWLDDQLQLWWGFAVRFVPMNIAPNTLTVSGFACSVVAVILAVKSRYPTFEGPPPTWTYFMVALALFGHQTLDGVDGKQARRTNSSSPLGQIFDHGCDAFSTVFWAYCAASGIWLGISVWTLSLVIAMESLLIVYAWLELKFHVFKCNTGIAIGVTEGQTVVIVGHVIIGCLSLMSMDWILAAPLGQIINIDLSWLPFNLGDRFEPQLQQLPTNVFIISFFITIIGGTVIFDVSRSLMAVSDVKQALRELLSFVVHIGFQCIFFRSGVASAWPLWTAFILTANTSIIVLRVQISAICRLNYSAFQWPVMPFYAAATLLHFIGKESYYTDLAHPTLSFYVLTALSIWNVLFLHDFLATTINDICQELGIFCFSIRRPREKVAVKPKS